MGVGGQDAHPHHRTGFWNLIEPQTSGDRDLTRAIEHHVRLVAERFADPDREFDAVGGRFEMLRSHAERDGSARFDAGLAGAEQTMAVGNAVAQSSASASFQWVSVRQKILPRNSALTITARLPAATSDCVLTNQRTLQNCNGMLVLSTLAR